jgi:hypothetical protein
MKKIILSLYRHSLHSLRHSLHSLRHSLHSLRHSLHSLRHSLHSLRHSRAGGNPYKSNAFQIKSGITTMFTILMFLLLAPSIHAFPKESFITVTIPVRGYEDWGLKDQLPLDLPLFYYEQASQSGIPTSYMLRYDAIQDQEISSKLADLVATNSEQILGGLLEVTPKLAKAANATYQNHGSFNSANHLFLSGYSREDRLRIIDTYMETFFERFGNYPPVVGVDSLDSYSFNYLVSHYSVIAAFVADEAYQNQNLRQWGGYLAEPYLPSQTNLLVPAQSAQEKTNGVIFKWSPVDPHYVYQQNLSPRSKTVSVSELLDTYALKSLNESTHLNVRLDNNFQLVFHTEDKSKRSSEAKDYVTNLVTELQANQEKHTLRFKSTAEMGEIIKARYPETSPASFFKFGDIYWYQNPFYRLVLRQTSGSAEIIDFRVYNPKITGNYFHEKNIQTVVYQELPAIIDSYQESGNSISLDIDLEQAELTSEYWDLIIKDQAKTIRLEPKKVIFEGLTPPDLESNQIKVKTSKDSTQWLINPTPPFEKLMNSNFFVFKLILVLFIIFLILKTFIKRPPKTIFLGLVFGFLALVPVAFSGQIYSFGLGLWGPNGHDAVFHLSVINSLKDSLTSLSHPQLSGFFLKNYHLGVDWLIALISNLTGLNPAILFFRWLPIILASVIVAQMVKLLASWKFSEVATRLALFLAFLAGSFGFIFTLVTSGNPFAGESLFWMNQSVSIFLNPPFALSIALLLIFLNLYQDLQGPTLTGVLDHRVGTGPLGQKAEGRSVLNGRFLLLILVGGLLAQVKVYAFILLLLSLLVLKELKLLIGIGLVGLVLSLPTLGLEGSPFMFSPLWFPKSLIAAQDKLNWSKLAQAWQVYEVNGVYFKLFIVNLLALGIYVVGNLGIRVIGLLNILDSFLVEDRSPGVGLRLRHSPGVRSVTLVKAIIVLGLLIPLFFIQVNNPWNTIQFSYYSLFFLSFFTAKQVVTWLSGKSHKPWVLLAGGLLFLVLTLPTTIGTLKDYITPYSASKISFTELNALEFLESQEKGVVISPLFGKAKASQFPAPKSLYAYTTTAYISAFSGQTEYLADLINLDITGFNYQERAKNTQRLFNTQNSAWAKSFLESENISYVYQTPLSSLQFQPQKACLSPIFESGEITIYKFTCHVK